VTISSSPQDLQITVKHYCACVRVCVRTHVCVRGTINNKQKQVIVAVSVHAHMHMYMHVYARLHSAQ